MVFGAAGAGAAGKRVADGAKGEFGVAVRVLVVDGEAVRVLVVDGVADEADGASTKAAPAYVFDESDVKKKVYDVDAGIATAAGSDEPAQRADDQPFGVVTHRKS